MFENRQHAGELLSIKIPLEINTTDAVVLGIARGGIVVAKEVAGALVVPLMPVVIKKIGSPQSNELALGALGPEDTRYLDHEMLVHFGLGRTEVKQLVEETMKKQQSLEIELKHARERIEQKTVIIVDDGVATGATAICAALYADKNGAKQIILATPIISPRVAAELGPYIDKIISLKKEESFRAVGEFYKSFPQVTTEEVRKLL